MNSDAHPYLIGKADKIADYIQLMSILSQKGFISRYLDFDVFNKLAKEVGSPFRLIKEDDNE